LPAIEVHEEWTITHMISFKTIGCAVGILLPVTLTVLGSDESPSTRISVMSYNIENGGAQVDFNKTAEAIKKSGADVVGIQEAWGNTARLAKAVGWKYYDQRQHIISRFPLFEAPELLPDKMVAMANMHLPDEPYGPDMVRSDLPDRVDFVYTAGKSKILESKIVGEAE